MQTKMQTKRKRAFSVLLLLLLFVVPLFFILLVGSLRKMVNSSEFYAISSPYSSWDHYDTIQRGDQQVYLVDSYICDKERDIKISVYPYSHFNADYDLPMTREGYGYFKIKKVRYKFQVVDETLKISSIEFFTDKHWRTVYEENGKLYEKRTDTNWPFDGARLICEVSAECGFYDPIAISGMDGCGILLLSSDDPGIETDMVLYLFNGHTWDKTDFRLPDGTELDSLRGYVCRKADFSSRDTINGTIGNMEICLKGQNGGYVMYQVSYSNGIVVLTANNDMEITDKDLLSWAY